ncbi:WD domain, G-beta repeat protein [Ancylostoma ceylanicum]|uniref:WD domain, G-beta repeat protein n=1 Tax=Ancylostoma ceylanicum TaxID=53326 RepID=A0A0D6LAP4_9BILA|nr:WD domain, G-beta repeat protein [Ancylostoma ceylanicum]
MGITKDYLRYVHSGSCGCVGSVNGEICAVDEKTCAVTACENVNFYNMRTNEKVNEISEYTKDATCVKLSRDKRWLAVGYADGVIRLFDRNSDELNGVIFSGHKKGVNCLEFSEDGLTLASGGKVYSFSIVNNETLMVVASAEAELVVYQLIWLEEGIVTSSKEGNEPEEKKPLTESDADRNDIEDMANGADRIVDVYRVFTEAESSKRLAKKLKNAKRKATSEVISAGISEEDIKKDVTILIAPVGEYRSQAKIKWADFTTKCKVDQDGAVNYSVFALMSNNTVHLLNFKCDISSNTVSFECTSTVDHLGHRSDIRALSVASSNNAIVSGGGDELIIWNVHSLRPVACLRSEGMVDVTACVFATGDGHVVAGTKGFITVSSDKKAKFWSYEVVSEGTQLWIDTQLRFARLLKLITGVHWISFFREKDYEARLVEEEDVVSGEVIDPEASLATVKNTQSVVSAENIIEAVDIVRNEKVQAKENPESTSEPHYQFHRNATSDREN